MKKLKEYYHSKTLASRLEALEKRMDAGITDGSKLWKMIFELDQRVRIQEQNVIVQNMNMSKECECQNLQPGAWIYCDDVNNPHCYKCGRKIIHYSIGNLIKPPSQFCECKKPYYCYSGECENCHKCGKPIKPLPKQEEYTTTAPIRKNYVMCLCDGDGKNEHTKDCPLYKEPKQEEVREKKIIELTLLPRQSVSNDVGSWSNFLREPVKIIVTTSLQRDRKE